MPTFSCNLFVLTKRGGVVFVRITTQGGDIYTSIRNVFVYWGHVPYPLHDSAANARHYKEMRAIKVVAYDVNVCLFNHHLPFRSFQRVIILKTNMFVFRCFIASRTFYCTVLLLPLSRIIEDVTAPQFILHYHLFGAFEFLFFKPNASCSRQEIQQHFFDDFCVFVSDRNFLVGNYSGGKKCSSQIISILSEGGAGAI